MNSISVQFVIPQLLLPHAVWRHTQDEQELAPYMDLSRLYGPVNLQKLRNQLRCRNRNELHSSSLRVYFVPLISLVEALGLTAPFRSIESTLPPS